MALYPDRIVLKSSTDGDEAVKNQIEPTAGSSPVIGGELVISRSNGQVNLFALDALGAPTLVGSTVVDGATAPSVLLNFEEDGTDTATLITSLESPNPAAAAAKFGSKGFVMDTTLGHWASEQVQIVVEKSPFLSTDKFTLEFWIKGDAADWWNLDGSNNPQGAYQLFGYQDLHNGPAPFSVYLDCGSTDRGGSGSNTSHATDMAIGSVVFGLGYGETHSQTNGIPATGEIVSSRNFSVLDSNWHHVAVTHEGRGVYAIFIDGQVIERNAYSLPVNFNDTEGTGEAMPMPFNVGGYLSTNTISTKQLYGFVGSLDAIALYRGVALYKGFVSFPVPTSAPDGTVRAEPSNTLRSLLDVNIPQPSGLTDGDVLQWSASEQAWVENPAPAFNISGNNLDDIGNVSLDLPVNIIDGELLAWDQAGQQWINKDVVIDDIGGVDLSGQAVGSIIRYDGIQWEAVANDYGNLVNAPGALSQFVDDVFTTLNNCGDVHYITAPAQGDVLVYNLSTAKWVPQSAPPANIGTNSIGDLSDVTPIVPSGFTSANDYFLAYNHAGATWEGIRIEYDEIAGRPTHLSNLTNNLDLGDFTNDDEDYLNEASLAPLGLSVFNDVTIATPLESHILVYRSGQWVNEYGPPANISNNSIGDLANVTYTQTFNYTPGELTIEGMGELIFDSPDQANNIAYMASYDAGLSSLGFSAIRSSDDTGSWVTVSRGGGVDIRSDVNLVRFRGKPDTTTNRVELRLETGDASATPATGEYIGFKLPAAVNESTTYFLPGEDGDVGDVLATDGTGNLSWVARISNPDLADLGDVDLATVSPSNGVALIYNSAASTWIPGAAQADLSSESINALSDVDTTTAAPADGQGLGWDQAAGNWAPMDVAADLSGESIGALSDVDTTTSAPTDGDALKWSSANSQWEPGAANSFVDSVNGETGAVSLGIEDMNDYAEVGFVKYIASSTPTTNPAAGVAEYTTSWDLILSCTDDDGNDRFDAWGTVAANDTITLKAENSAEYTTTVDEVGNYGIVNGKSRISLRFDDDTITTQLSDGDTLHLFVAGKIAAGPTDGQALVWDDSGSKWVHGDVATDLSAESVDALSDVDTTTVAPTDGQALLWDSAAGKWEPGDPPSGNTKTIITPFAQAFIDTNSSGTGSGCTWGAYNSSTGEMTITFDVAQPDTDYAIITDREHYDSHMILTTGKTVNGFTAEWVGNDGQSSLSPSMFPGGFICYASDPTVTVGGAAGGDLGDLNDVNAPSPGDGQALIWDNANSEWAPGTVSAGGASDLDGLSDVDTSTTAPLDGQALIWDNANSEWKPGTVASSGGGINNIQEAGDYALNQTFTANVFTETTGTGSSLTAGQMQGDSYWASGNFERAYISRYNADGSENSTMTSVINTTDHTNPVQVRIVIGGVASVWNCYSSGTIYASGAFQIRGIRPAVSGPSAWPLDTNLTAGDTADISSPNGVDVPLADGDILQWNAAQSKFVPADQPDLGPATATVTTSSLAADASETITLTGTGRAGMFIDVQTSHAAWVTFYSTEALRTADSARAQTTAPATSSGVLFEVLTSNTNAIPATPAVSYANGEASAVSSLPIKVVNRSGSTAAITVTVRAFSFG